MTIRRSNAGRSERADLRARLASARLCLIAGAPQDGTDSSCERILAAVRGGVAIVQLRMKAAATIDVARAASRLRSVLAPTGALLIVNDDVAAAAEADGVHLGQSDAPIEEARAALGADALIGISTHSPAEAENAARRGADYIGVGAMFETTTKAATTLVGPAMLARVLERVALPAFAIGGIDLENVTAIRAAGGDRIAVSRAILGAGDPETAARELLATIRGSRGAVESA